MEHNQDKKPNALYHEFIHLQMQLQQLHLIQSNKSQGQGKDSYHNANKLWNQIKPHHRMNAVNNLRNNSDDPETNRDNKKIEDFFNSQNRKVINTTQQNLNDLINQTPAIHLVSALKQIPVSRSKQEKFQEALNRANDIFKEFSDQKQQTDKFIRPNSQYIEFYKSKLLEFKLKYPNKNHNELTSLVSLEWKMTKTQNTNPQTIKEKKKAKENNKLDQRISHINDDIPHTPDIYNHRNLGRVNFQFTTSHKDTYIISGSKLIELLKINPDCDTIKINLQDFAQRDLINTLVLNGLKHLQNHNIKPLKQEINVKQEQQDLKMSRDQGKRVISPNNQPSQNDFQQQEVFENQTDEEEINNQSSDELSQSKMMDLINNAFQTDTDDSQNVGQQKLVKNLYSTMYRKQVTPKQ